MLRRKFLMAVAAAAVAGLLGPTSARAGFTLQADVYDSTGATHLAGTSINGGAANPFSTGNQSLGAGITVFNVSSSFLDNSPLNQIMQNVTTQLKNTSSDTERVVISIAYDKFSLGTTGNKLFFNSQADLNSPDPVGLIGGFVRTVITDGGTTEDYAGSPTSPNGVAIPSVVGAQNTGATASFTRSANANYNVTQYIYIDLAAGATVNITTTSTIATPAPASAILALAGAPIFGVFGWMRRRKAVIA